MWNDSFHSVKWIRVQLETDDPMHQMGDIIQLYEPGPLPALEPILHVGFLGHVLCRVPLIPCYMGGSEHPTVPHRFARSSKVPNGRADRHDGTGDGSRLYEVNMWMWKFGRGMPRSRTVAEAERIIMQLLCKANGTKNKKIEPQLWINIIVGEGIIKQIHVLQCFIYFHIVLHSFTSFHIFDQTVSQFNICEKMWKKKWKLPGPIFCVPFHRSISHSILQWTAKSDFAVTPFHSFGQKNSFHIVSHVFTVITECF